MLENEEGHSLLYGQDLIGKEVEVKSVFLIGTLDLAAVEYEGAGFCFRTSMLRHIGHNEARQVERMTEIMESFPRDDSKPELARLPYRAGCRLPEE